MRRLVPRRRGLSLLEVLLSMTIFLLSSVAIFQLLDFANDRAQDVRDRSEAAHLCSAKMAEIVAGAVAMTDQGGTTFEEAPDYQWSMTAVQGDVTGVYTVSVEVTRERELGQVRAVMTRMVLDPAMMGSAQDQVVVLGVGTATTGGTTGSPTDQSGSSGGQSGGSSGSGSSGGASGGGSSGGSSGSGRTGGVGGSSGSGSSGGGSSGGFGGGSSGGGSSGGFGGGSSGGFGGGSSGGNSGGRPGGGSTGGGSSGGGSSGGGSRGASGGTGGSNGR